jgi:hypothetical protein
MELRFSPAPFTSCHADFLSVDASLKHSHRYQFCSKVLTLLASSVMLLTLCRRMHCEEKYRLLSVYQAKVSAHSAAVDGLAVTRGKVPEQDYTRLWALTENARSESEAASRALLQHTREHGC